VLFPGVSQLDESSAPRMGYADLDMVQKTFLNNEQLPFVQGDESKDKHVAMTRRVIQDNKIVAVILASLSDSFIQKTIDLKSIDATEENTIELKQDKRLLITQGNKPVSESDEVAQFKIANTNWTLYYYYDSRANFTEIGMALIAVFAPLLLVLLGFALVQRKLSALLTEDLESVTQACKDLLKEKAQGSYPTSLRETSGIIMELMQFKRILDSRKNDPSNYMNAATTISGRADEFESVDVESFFDD
jgi:phosphomannomutase/phosphoglucomutase